MKLQSIGLAIALGLLFGSDLLTVPGINPVMRPAYANEPIPKKSEWKTKKRQLALPDGLGSGFDMGDEFGKFHKDYSKAGATLTAKLTAVQRLKGNLTSYLDAVRQLNPANPNARRYLTDVLATVQQLEGEIQAMLNAPTTDKPERMMTQSGQFPITIPAVQAVLNATNSSGRQSRVLWSRTYQDADDFAEDWTFDKYNNPGHQRDQPEGQLAVINFATFNATVTTLEDMDNEKNYYRPFVEYLMSIQSEWDNPKYSGSTIHVAVIESSLVNPGARGEAGRRPRLVILFKPNQPNALSVQMWQVWLAPAS